MVYRNCGLAEWRARRQPDVWVWGSYGRAGPEVQVRDVRLKVVGCMGTEAPA